MLENYFVCNVRKRWRTETFMEIKFLRKDDHGISSQDINDKLKW